LATLAPGWSLRGVTRKNEDWRKEEASEEGATDER
jgi:hypothetical protein